MTLFIQKSPIFFAAILFVIASCTQSQNDTKEENISTENVNNERFVLPPLPASVMFCGKEIKLDNFDVKERLDKELIVNTYFHSSTIQALKRANRYFEDIEKTLKSENVPDDFKYLCLIESGLKQVTSPAGAKGFWQFMPQTAKEYGLKVNEEIDERMHIEKSTLAACKYLKNAHLKFNDWALTAAAYNRGVGGIVDDLKEQEVSSYFDLHLNAETGRYVFRLLAMKIIFENQEAYGFKSEELELYEPIITKSIKVDKSIDNLKHWAREQGSNYRMLRLLNPWIKGNKLSVKGTHFTLQLPK